MDAPNQLKEILSTDTVRLVDEDIYSILPDGLQEHHYDRRATIYDLVVSTHVYNAIMWGSSPNVLHLFQDAEGLIANLNGLLTKDGSLFLTSLVSSNRFIGDAYLRALYRAKEFVRPRSRGELERIMKECGMREVSLRVKGNMAFVISHG